MICCAYVYTWWFCFGPPQSVGLLKPLCIPTAPCVYREVTYLRGQGHLPHYEAEAQDRWAQSCTTCSKAAQPVVIQQLNVGHASTRALRFFSLSLSPGLVGARVTRVASRTRGTYRRPWSIGVVF